MCDAAALAAVRDVIATMRSDDHHFRVAPGGSEIVRAVTVDDWADAIEHAIAAQPGPEMLPYARLLELCAEFGIDETDTLKHRLDDWERWNTDLRSGALTTRPASSVVEIAVRIAAEAHEGQRDTVTGEPYINHVARVAALVESTDAKAVAWLHDVVEDNPAWTLERLGAAGIPARLMPSVSLLTRRPACAYADYIDTIATSGDPLAVVVKLADIRDHLQPDCPERLRPRYEAALVRLARVRLETAASPSEREPVAIADPRDAAVPLLPAELDELEARLSGERRGAPRVHTQAWALVAIRQLRAAIAASHTDSQPTRDERTPPHGE